MATPTWIEYGERATGDNDPVYGAAGIVNRAAKTIWAMLTVAHNTDGSHQADALNPSGAMVMFGGASAPTGWLLCDGAAVSRATYATLFAAIGTTWGVGNGSTTFNVPDLRGRAPIGVGQGSGLTARTLGQKIGEEAHALIEGENGAHAHVGGAHTHTTTISTVAGGTATNPKGGDGGTSNVSTGSGGAVATTSSGSGTAHNTMQPSAVVNFIIKY